MHLVKSRCIIFLVLFLFFSLYYVVKLKNEVIKIQEIISNTLKKYEAYVNSGQARLFKLIGLDKVEFKATGTKVTDILGNEYIDCVGGYGTFILGHKPDEVIKAVKDQLDFMPLSSKVFLNSFQADLSEKLAEITPSSLQYSFICNSGTEAVEGALKLARLATAKKEIIATSNSFHGKSLGSLSVTGREKYKEKFTPLLPEVKHVPFGDVTALAEQISHQTAAVILEPIQGEGGIIVPPNNYLKQVRELCDGYDALLIFDEIQTALGRTGELFACNAYDVVPDIMTLAKALGGGVMPIGAFIAKKELWTKFNQYPFLHTSTFGGNPLACRAAIKTLEILTRDNLARRSKKIGKYFKYKLKKLQNLYPEIIKEVRGKGLMIGVELREKGQSASLISELLKKKILVAYTLNQQSTLRFEPPLIITRAEVQKVISALDNSLDKIKSKIS